MATASVPEATPQTETPIPFFSFNAAYLVDPDATNASLRDDAQCWLSAATEIVSTLASELDEDGSSMRDNPGAVIRMLWGAFHLLEMANGAVGAINTKGVQS